MTIFPSLGAFGAGLWSCNLAPQAVAIPMGLAFSLAVTERLLRQKYKAAFGVQSSLEDLSSEMKSGPTKLCLHAVGCCPSCLLKGRTLESCTEWGFPASGVSVCVKRGWEACTVHVSRWVSSQASEDRCLPCLTGRCPVLGLSQTCAFSLVCVEHTGAVVVCLGDCHCATPARAAYRLPWMELCSECKVTEMILLDKP